MQIGYIGLGKMGYNMVLRLLEKGHDVVVFNKTEEATKQITQEGARPAYSLAELVSSLKIPRTVWIMVPHKAVDEVLANIVVHLTAGDTIIDGGNSPYKESMRRARELQEMGVNFLDVGVSGGPGGARNGACLMIGGIEVKFKEYTGLFRDISTEGGYGYVGRSGAGHFVKMVHNGIEYGMMQAIAEGFEVMKKSEFELKLTQIADVYNHKSVIESRLVEWLKNAFEQHGEDLQNISGSVAQSGEGTWTVDTAQKLDVPVSIIEGSVKFRKESQERPSYTGKVVSALRNQFGGHDVSN